MTIGSNCRMTERPHTADTFGGKQMDMFMDRLAQKLTAQEIIKANTTADTEELNRLRNQVAEYNECLARLQQLTEEAAAKLHDAPGSVEDISRLLEESVEKIRSLQQDSTALEQLQKILADRLEEADRKQGERLSGVTRIMDEKLENVDRTLDERLTEMDKNLAERMGHMGQSFEQKLYQVAWQSQEDSEEQISAQLAERLNAIDENTHKECVKVYRNVQAVVMEESGKQTTALNEAKTKVDSADSRLSVVLRISATALIFSLVSAVLQVLSFLNIM